MQVPLKPFHFGGEPLGVRVQTPACPIDGHLQAFKFG